MNFLEDVKTVAIVGLSRDKVKPSHEVAVFLKKQGIRVIPVNPKTTVLIKEKSYSSILEIPKEVTIDVVAIYRKSEDVGRVIDEVVKRGNIKILWLPQGAENLEAEKIAYLKGFTVFSNFCLLHEYKKLIGKRKTF